MADFTIETLTIPATIDAPDAADFIEMTRVRNAVEAHAVGNSDLSYEPAELLPNWQDPYQPQVCLIARIDGKIVARALYMPTIEDDAKEVELAVEVLPEFRRRGIGSALYARLLELCATDDRPILQGYFFHRRADESEQLPSPTGFGSVPSHNPETRFLLENGFQLEQVERMSRLDLPPDGRKLATLVETARLAAGSDYRIIRWTGRTPPEWLADMAVLHQRMSTDAPSAGLDATEEMWDEERMRSLDDRLQDSPRTMLIVVAEHVPSHTLAGFTELSVPPEVERPVEQQDTLVLKEHRGHRLGLLLKLENLQYLAETHPGHPSVFTFNAEENRPMLTVNEAMGFAAMGHLGGWKKVI